MREAVARNELRVVLRSMAPFIRLAARFSEEVRKLLSAMNFTIEIRLNDKSMAYWYRFNNGKLKAGAGFATAPDAVLKLNSAEDAMKVMVPWRNYLEMINLMKNFCVDFTGDDRYVMHFMRIAGAAQEIGVKYGEKMPDGTTKYINNTNGGPVCVYVKDGKIIRITNLELTDKDAEGWTIEARGKRFTPPRRQTVTSYSQSSKSTIYSKDRLLYPMKRVDFDPNGERHPENRGKSEYVRITWDEAYDIVANEIMRVKKTYGPGAILNSTGSHHTWGNIGYYLSARLRFFNMIGATYVAHNPDSWEGWYWGGMHHWGNSLRLGMPDGYGTVEDCLKHCEMIVFWSSDPECTHGIYAAQEGTVRRRWAKELGIECVHIDPFYNHTAQFMGGKWLSPRPAEGNAMSLAIAYVWITEDSYDKWFVENRTTGFEQWRDYVLGKEDGIAKTPEWQEAETNIPARVIRALARQWAKKRTYLSCGGRSGFGSACRSATGIEWARSMIYLAAMQGIGKPGVNIGNLQTGTPVSTRFFFPGYAEGGLSGDLVGSGLAQNMYQRMPQVVTMNTVAQTVPRLQIPEAIMEGKALGYAFDGKTIEGQFRPVPFPAPGYSTIKMYYKYGGSHIGTMVQTNRYAKMYQDPKLEFVCNQSIWMEGEAKFADIILPACTNFERWDISETVSCSGYSTHSFLQSNYRVLTLQHKCIEPLGESKSDFEIFAELASRLGMGTYFTEGTTELGWCKRLFDGTDLPQHISWKQFLKRGYYVVPAPKPEERDPVSWNWYYEGRPKDLPEVSPLPSDYSGKWREGVQTQSGKIEFVSSSLMRYDPNDPERPPMSKFIENWEGHRSELFKKYPLALISPHNRYSFHTMSDGKDSYLLDIPDHRVLINGWYYWIARINTKDAAQRGIKQYDVIEMYNDRGSVLLAAELTERVPQGTVHSYESSAIYAPIGEIGASPDRGGCVNILTTKRPIIKKSHSAAWNSCLVEIRLWNGEI
ncbi:pyrogallol hydroxytransferase large subunit [Brenneria goodwinii]|uniref:Pyrogallol hydroxytransferase large subunit n=2 Tax=Brenneria goodwinii TaxID=1109412 RepID=A0AAE8EKQ3_9GAMM|nr:pyrogallol hydroxytransferase large subunit [Brenneria goodwinii]RLM17430.1 pyrogallol hydroxytransferase large subunit [Brenneria goodwinii]